MGTIKRLLYNEIQHRMQPNMVMLLFGARRVGKTVLMMQLVDEFDGRKMVLNGEDYDTQAMLADQTIANYRNLFGNIDLLAIDEAQNITNIGNKLKLIVDEIPGIRVIASGSSSFDLKNTVGEPLVGRSAQFLLTPFSQRELSQTENSLQTRQNLESRLIYGAYPSVALMSDNQQRKEYLRDIVDAYLLKDILNVDGIKNAAKMRDLLRLVAFQTGSEVSLDELGKQLSISKNTVARYLDLLSKVYVVFKVGGFSRNLRKEVAKSAKWYFYDNGIRNAVINNFSPLSLRQDGGRLWENYIVAERMKRNLNGRHYNELYFWRTYDQQEIDLIEINETEIQAFEIKKGEKNPPCPKAFSDTYTNAQYNVIRKDNYLDFV